MSKQEMNVAAAKYRSTLTDGTVLCVDPSSGSSGSMPGWALFKDGVLVESGLLVVNHKNPVNLRLREIMELLMEKEAEHCPDLLLVEKIRGNRAHNFLRWACGCIVAALQCPHIEVCISTWRRYIDKATYEKGDENDAIAIGTAMINLAKGIPAPAKKRTTNESGKTRSTRESMRPAGRSRKRVRRR